MEEEEEGDDDKLEDEDDLLRLRSRFLFSLPKKTKQNRKRGKSATKT